ncbi:hypothetical protein [Tenacibaculum ovolyticum]|uniref:hypothetical protein n=1 Tax=Tenacibaculum ovolyticum TaxID=104270 RepID=UPI0007ED81B0|nr:hypothetical protein [Tenacibaculum ovolyticum]
MKIKKNERIQEIWNELELDESIKLSKYQLAIIFDYGYQYYKTTLEDSNNLKQLSLADLQVLEAELSELVDGCTLPNKELDANGKKYNRKLNEVSLEMENRIHSYVDSINKKNPQL